ncbi:MAG: glycosyltransferase family 9 protein [Aridibacter famidurans]|nr:glycosyltransferase family 9 protein [Aridibacter famidurans]
MNAQATASKAVDWPNVRKVLVIRLRSIGDTVLATPTLRALRDFLPDARIDILLEDWVAPLLEGHTAVDSVVRVSRDRSGRLSAASRIRKTGYDLVINLHGGTTSTFLTRATGARYRVGNSVYQYSFLYNLKLRSSAEFWDGPEVHSAEQQLALAGFLGVPVSHRPASELPYNTAAASRIDERLRALKPGPSGSLVALIHPAAATFTKQWETDRFARIAGLLAEMGFFPVAVGTPSERPVLEAFSKEAGIPVGTFSDLTLPDITALARRSSIFVGNDSGIAHIAAAVGTPPVVVFGSSNRVHWKPWTNGPSKIVYKDFECQPCPGYECRTFGTPRCILEVPAEAVMKAIDELLESA